MVSPRKGGAIFSTRELSNHRGGQRGGTLKITPGFERRRVQAHPLRTGGQMTPSPPLLRSYISVETVHRRVYVDSISGSVGDDYESSPIHLIWSRLRVRVAPLSLICWKTLVLPTYRAKRSTPHPCTPRRHQNLGRERKCVLFFLLFFPYFSSHS